MSLKYASASSFVAQVWPSSRSEGKQPVMLTTSAWFGTLSNLFLRTTSLSYLLESGVAPHPPLSHPGISSSSWYSSGKFSSVSLSTDKYFLSDVRLAPLSAVSVICSHMRKEPILGSRSMNGYRAPSWMKLKKMLAYPSPNETSESSCRPSRIEYWNKYDLVSTLVMDQLLTYVTCGSL